MDVGALIAKLGIDTTDYNKGLDDAAGKTKTSSSKMTAGLSSVGGAVVMGAMAGVVAGVVAITGAMTASVVATMGWAETLDGIGDVLGTSTSESAALAVAIKGVGGNVPGLTSQMAKLATGLLNAKGEMGPSGQALTDMGISFQDANGNILPAIDIIQAVADKLGVMPDGLAKTDAMMALFGKSGKDLSDTLAAMAGGGLADADAKAKALGLSMSDEAANGAIMFGRELNTLKMGLQGAFVQIGTQVIPLLSELALKIQTWIQSPEVQSGIAKLTEFIKGFANAVIEFIPQAIQWFTNIYNFLVEHEGIIVGILVALGVAVGVFVYTSVIPAAIAMIAALAPVVLPILAIAAVVALLYEAWTNNWGGIRDILTEVWESNLKPIFETVKTWLDVNLPIALKWLSDTWTNVLQPAITQVWNWLSTVLMPFLRDVVYPWVKDKLTNALQILSNFWTGTLQPAIEKVWNWMSTVLIPFLQNVVFPWLQENIPKAIQTLSDFWNNTLLPAITAVWNFLTTYVIPIFEDVIEIAGKLGEIALKALAGFWEKTLKPALETVWKYFNENILPIMRDVKDFIVNDIGPKVQWLANNVFAPLAATLEGAVKRALDWLHTKLESIKGFLDKFKLPDWLSSNSPTPFEIGLLGIGRALNDLSSYKLPDFSAKLNLLPADLDLDVASTAGLVGSTGSNANTYNFYGVRDDRSMVDKIKTLNLLYKTGAR
jgi:TP901 family phage tail tape measure protein